MIAMTMMMAIAFAVAKEWFPERLETRQRPRMAATETAAFADYSVSSSNLISIAAGDLKRAKYEEEQYFWLAILSLIYETSERSHTTLLVVLASE